ncbi:hypothetical protein [Microbacterium sp.]|uniref:hypothetical protein n=1 Tax=Microbacterium sp. TaxID=51671 RepID=UPI0039E21C8E
MPANDATDSSREWVERWLSPPRLGVYLNATGGDHTAALDLYEWNARLGAAFGHDLAHLEVALRNAYDRALTEHLGLSTHWTAAGTQVFAPVLRVRKRGPHGKVTVDINAKSRASLERAIREAGGRKAPPGKVIAQLTFGFWRYLTSAAHEVTLWRPALHHAFPPGTSRPDVDTRVGRLHELRNRVAHHEPLLGIDITARHGDLLHVAALLDPQLRAYIREHSTVADLVAARPVTGR